MLNAIIVDDENRAIKTLQLILNEYCKNVKVINTANSAIDAIKKINNNMPDLVFLDIEMPNGNGFDVLEAFPKRNFDVIFVTAYNNFALKAIKFAVADYILKPIDIEEVTNAINKIIERKKQNVQTQPDLTSLIQNIKNQTQRKISIPTTNGVEFVLLNEILYVEADRSYCKIFLTQKRNIMISKSMNEIELLLPDNEFVKIHKSHIVNLAFVKKLLRTDGGTVELIDGTQLLIAKTKKEEFTLLIQRYIKSNN
ncbi:MAG: DNA-binding response regulator [Bacteroidetes bacterium CG02_land_8_20_14_3_00_31_25]|nr:response regulator transcription factor [Bacteroidota bacterium]PIV59025.1 MAG: DNA-binding response regulator [Bacteroidetes bacterium CG02_land_8_20_14_3_00_31_25]PIX36466.1 MAG: DNA-binding response regulator [Bacteroidetes bacterium CG_4_8_14_3_um_filter_31_14]PIY06970.1 MAG: DNA-binding response regulator [Bacteroidetes bacterium CG_4_10_14_3_um_filter_31_20]